MSESPVDEEALFELVDEDPVFLEHLVETFREDCKAYLQAIREAVREEDAWALVQEAHGLKGAAANLQADPVSQVSRRLEQMGRERDLDEASAIVDELEDEIDRLIPVLEELVEKTA